MSEEMTPEQQMEAQKANCPFCKIAKGEIPAVKVYEDDFMVGILDINPLANGHTILFPKEHVPIMQMMPPASFNNMFSKLPDIIRGIKKGAVCNSVNLYVASGGVAGQQMPHFLLHIIPREDGDGIDTFNKNPTNLDQTKMTQLVQAFRENLGAALKPYAKHIAPKNQQQTQPQKSTLSHTVSAEQKKLIAEFLESQVELRELLLKNPEKFAEIIVQNQDVKNIFAGIDIAALSERLRPAYAEENSNEN